MDEKNQPLKRGQTFPLTIKRLGINGEGVGFFKKQAVFIPGALPGEEVVAEAVKVSQKFAEAKIKKIRKRSSERVAAPCPVYESCGGCQLQHLSYEGQLNQKRDMVKQAFERYTKFPADKLETRKTIGMDNPWGYRNKSQLQAGNKEGKILAGLYGLNSHELVDITECKIHHPESNRVTEVVKDILQDLNIPAYNEKKRRGFVRTIVTRVSFATGQTQLVLVTAKTDFPKKELFIEEVKKRLPDITSVMQNVNNKKTSVIFGEEMVHMHGDEVIEEQLGDFSFELSARSFFQLNPQQTVTLYNEAKKAARLTGKEKVVDAYCGVGTIGMWVADEAGEVRGMDTIAPAIEDAKKNAERHGIKNAEFYTGEAEKLLPEWVNKGWKPDVVMVDPPRSGLHQKLIDTILKVKPKRIVYISCNPSTLAKNAAQLAKKYDVKYMQPVDMFPHTAHIEVVAVFEMRK
ncbi:23S rRNA (uracil(1939)-C(5))-methyltransferase RlmD [Bacillus marinisedimentorum]|uniref:23S rRNA (uracil(1939)-C(5))-methyltransferase RlmD n=1 Tax=Bacillus marinisedimentorum TaxID=1821260 RepID=UPI00087272F8|nr:23S rRNA (uracil(1939)-C(5))-methyltransferase RlmD [Bacillus marinisedimentorum]